MELEHNDRLAPDQSRKAEGNEEDAQGAVTALPPLLRMMHGRMY